MKRISNFLKRKRAGQVVPDDGEILREGLPDTQESRETREMIRGIRELASKTVKEVMVPRIDTVFISVSQPIEEILDKIIACGHSRFPVYRDTIDNVIGMLYVKDLLQCYARQEPIQLDKIIRRTYFVPESKRLDGLLREFKKRRVHIAVSVDEYGGVSGVICLEDILEEIVGDIQDEFDNEREEILELDKGVYLCDARVDIEDVNEELGLNIPDDDFDTVGGFVFSLFGKIPVRYEKAAHRGVDFIIQNMDGHKIKMVKIILKGGGAEDEESI